MATITKTIGTTGRDYSTIQAWEDDLDDDTPYDAGDDAIGECYDDSDFDEEIDIAGGGTLGLNSITLTVASGQEHDGTANTGVRLLRSANAPVNTPIIEISTSVATVFEWLEIDFAGAYNIDNECVYTAVAGHEIHRLLIHGMDGSVNDCRIIYLNEASTATNCIVYDINDTRASSTTQRAIDGSISGSAFYNCTVHDIRLPNASSFGRNYGISATSGATITNCLATSITASSAPTECYTGGATESYNASDDATAAGTGSIINITAANQYVSTTGGSEDLHIIDGADVEEAGTDLTTTDGANIDIDGCDRDNLAGTLWSMGAHQRVRRATVGTTSRDYSTIQAWEDDLDDTTIHSANGVAIGDCYDDSDFDESVTINGGGTVGLDEIVLTVASGQRHDGTANTGVNIIVSTDRQVQMQTTVPTTIGWLDLDGGGSNHVNVDDGSGAGGSGAILTCINMLVHDTDYHNLSAGFSFDFNNRPTRVLNCIIYNLHSTSSGTGRAAGVDFGSKTYDSYCYNTTVYNITAPNGSAPDASAFAFDDDVNNIFRNCIGLSVSAADDASCYETATPSNATVEYCMSSDATASGTGSLTNQSASNEFVSLTGGSEDLHLKAGANAIEAGTDLVSTPTGVNIDIDGIDRDNLDGTLWSMGAHQKRRRATIGTSSRDYSTMQAWEDDLDDTTIYSANGEAIGDCYDDSDFNEAVTINGGGTVGLDYRTLTVASGERHDGTANTGVRLIGASVAAEVLYAATGPTDIMWMELDYNGNQWTGDGGIRADVSGVYSKNILHGGSTGLGSAGRAMRTAGGTVYIHNNILYDFTHTNSSYGAVAINDSNNGANAVDNNTIYGITHSGTGNAWGLWTINDSDVSIRNNISVGTTSGGSASDFTYNGTSGTNSNNLSSDATADDGGGSGHITGAAAGDLFVSVTGGSEDLHLKAGSTAIEAGTDLGSTPAGVNIDINGSNRDAFTATTWDIGADQFELIASIGTTGRDYSTMSAWNDDLGDTDIYGNSNSRAKGECYADSDFDEEFTIGDTPDLTRITLTVAEGERHDGTANTGVRILNSSGGTGVIISREPDTVIEWLEVDSNENGFWYQFYSVSIAGTDPGTIFRNNIVHGNHSGSSVDANGIRVNANVNHDQHVVNNIVYDILNSHSSANTYGVQTTATGGIETFIYNNTVVNIINNGSTGSAICYVLKDQSTRQAINNIGMDAGGTTGGTIADFDLGDGDFSNATVSHNLSSDTTAPDDSDPGTAIHSESSGDIFISTTGGSEDYHLKSGSAAIDAGTDLGTVLGVNISMPIDGYPNGYDRDVDPESIATTWDIGAAEFLSIGGETGTLTEGLELSDTAIANIAALINEGVELGDTYLSTLVTSTTEGVILGDITIANIITALTEGAELGDILAVTKIGATHTEGVLTGDQLLAAIKILNNYVEGLQAGDTWATSIHTSVVEGILLGDTWAGTIVGATEGAVTEGVTLGDSYLVKLIANLLEGVSLGDVLGVDLKSLAGDGASLGDTLSVSISTFLNEGVVLGDAWDGVVIGINTGTVTETVVLGDVLLGNITTSHTESTVLGEDLRVTINARIGEMGFPDEDKVVLGDTWTGTIVGEGFGSVTESLELGDTWIGTADQSVSKEEGLVLGDSYQAKILSSTNEGIILSDEYQLTISVTPTEGTVLTDEYVLSLSTSLTESIHLGDTWLTTVKTSLDEGVVLSDVYSFSGLIGFVVATIRLIAAVDAGIFVKPAVTSEGIQI